MVETVAKPGSLTEKAYAYLKEQIVSGNYGPNSIIDAAEIASTMGVSKTPVREATLRLANEGVLEVNARRGVRVLPLTADDLQDIYQVITALEVEAAGTLAHLKPSKQYLLPFYEQILRMRVSADSGNGEEWNRADEEFHRTLFNLSGNARLAEAGRLYRDKAQRAHFVALRLVPLDQKRQSVDAHAELIDAIQSGDADAARNMHHAQRERGGVLLVKALKAMKLDQL